jgi:hypothetical protein
MVAVNAFLLAGGPGLLKRLLAFNLGFFAAIVAPACLVMPFGDGFRIMRDKLGETSVTYIQNYENVYFLYWFFKFLVRTALVLGCLFALTFFAFHGLGEVFRFQKSRDSWRRVFFLFVWLVLVWLAVAIGKRVFYHYYVFLLAPLSLLAGAGLRNVGVPGKAAFVKKWLAVFMLIPAGVFFVEGAWNLSTMPPKVAAAVSYIRSQTGADDRIYVWGDVPQLYFFSGRRPSTVHFWSNILAGSSPGSPAMEYVRATGKNLQLNELMIKDFQVRIFKAKNPDAYKNLGQLTALNESELFTVEELLERIDEPYWQLVFADFLQNPPELFIDTSPSNLRGFGYYPIHRYELLKRFVLDNYRLETVVDRLIIYRLIRK